MNCSALILDVSKTMTMLMKATGKYVHSRITDPKGKEAYRASMKSCIDIVNAGWTNVNIIKIKIACIGSEHTYKPTLFNKHHSEITYHKLAVDNALDIVSKLETRFIIGVFDLEPRVYKYSLEYLREGSNGIFD